MGGVLLPLKSFADFPIKSRVLGKNRYIFSYTYIQIFIPNSVKVLLPMLCYFLPISVKVFLPIPNFLLLLKEN